MVISNGSAASCGVVILYRTADWDEIIETGEIQGGRICYLIIKDSNRTFSFLNIYSPNSSTDSIPFWESVMNVMIELDEKYPGIEHVLMGDFNVTLNARDNINRKGYSGEQEVRAKVNQVIEVMQIVDSRGVTNDNPQPSWKRGRVFSKLDYIFTSESLAGLITNYEHAWAITKSDHCMVKITLSIPTAICIGKGYYKINTDLLEDNETKTLIESHINESLKKNSGILESSHEMGLRKNGD